MPAQLESPGKLAGVWDAALSAGANPVVQHAEGSHRVGIAVLDIGFDLNRRVADYRLSVRVYVCQASNGPMICCASHL